MRRVVYALILAVCAQAAAAQESHLPGDRVRYRLEGERHWQMGFFQSISAHELVFTANETASLDTLPLSALNAVELHGGNHVSGSKSFSLRQLDSWREGSSVGRQSAPMVVATDRVALSALSRLVEELAPPSASASGSSR